MMLKIGDWLKTAAMKNPNKAAIITRNSMYSYKWIEEISNYLANDLIQKYNVTSGDRIALMLPNNIHFIIAYYAILKTGAACVPVHCLLKSKEVKYVLNHSEARILIAEKEELQDKLEVSDFPYLEHIIVSANFNDKNLFTSYMMRTSNNPKYQKTPVSNTEEDVAAIFYTSGTTGVPKGVVLTHENITAKMNPIKQAIKFSSEDRILSGLPMVYVYGQVMAMNFVIWCNATLILLENEIDSEIIWGLETHKPTVLMSTPNVYYKLNSYINTMKIPVTHHLRYAITGGSVSSSHLKKEFEKYFGVELLDSYGLTETTASFIVELPENIYRKSGSIGKCIANHEVQIIDETGAELPPGQVGEIAVRSNSVMKSYYKDFIRQLESSKNGWFFTGDLGYKDISGNFFLVDRRRDIIQTLGFVVSPREVEEVLLEHPKIMEAAVVGIPDEEGGEIIKAFVSPKPGHYVSENEVKAYLRKHLAIFKCPSVIEFLEEFPKSNSGKLLKRLLK
ncbi:AMP-binding protein [Bacillus sp. EB106-08-02-XG196]|uniref:class I adenylate-forming enzyme family protein n=1 Tax=Bacillus sp. EB106-08-02-XG196 TaxID=2737049 RepID=UPI0015C47EE1|nr:AMP-binding protein [Bacillus sp. EB106-08-02-XG196]NWQ43421.1 AMP-binding protein [Bacillus sp. EB106-08-02-XG196]